MVVAGGRTSGVGGRNTGVGGRKTGVGGRNTGVGGRRTGVGGRNTGGANAVPANASTHETATTRVRRLPEYMAGLLLNRCVPTRERPRDDLVCAVVVPISRRAPCRVLRGKKAPRPESPPVFAV